MIGGIDIVLWIPDDIPACDVILRTLRICWPRFVFQNGDDAEPLPPSWLPSPLAASAAVAALVRSLRTWRRALRSAEAADRSCSSPRDEIGSPECSPAGLPEADVSESPNVRRLS